MNFTHWPMSHADNGAFDNEDFVGSVPPPIVSHLRHLSPLSLCALVAVFTTLCTQLVIVLLKCFCLLIRKFFINRRRRQRVVDVGPINEYYRKKQKNEKLLCYTATLTPTGRNNRWSEGTNADRGHTVVDFGGTANKNGQSKTAENPFEMILPEKDGQCEDVLVEIARTVQTLD